MQPMLEYPEVELEVLLREPARAQRVMWTEGSPETKQGLHRK